MNIAKARDDLSATLNNLGDSIEFYRQGRRNQYRQVAIGLRTLLCDNNRIITRIYPTAALHPLNSFAAKLHKDESYLLKSLAFSLPGRIVMDGSGGAKIENLFYPGEPLLLDIWLAQPLFNEKITLKEFICSIADKEGKHLDIEYNDTLTFSKSVSLASVEMHPELVVTIGEYVHGVLMQVTKKFLLKEEG